jgi:predicted DCC family thiol-disulfide oxidoreductase YuxK
MLPLADREQLDSMVVSKNGQLFRHSTAALVIAKELGGFWKVLGSLGGMIPRPLRDLGYRLVARNRYRLFGQADACRLPQPGERERFLD